MVKRNVKRYFSKSAASYDKNAAMQREIEDYLINKILEYQDLAPERILDLGAGTASGSKKLIKAYPGTKVFACDIAHGMMKHAKKLSQDKADSIYFITADMEKLPFKANIFDMVFSSAAAHWLTDLEPMFNCAKRTLKDGGVFCFSTFGTNTLEELTIAFESAYKIFKKREKEHVNKFTPFYEIFSLLRKAGFDDIKAEVQAKKVKHPNAMALLKSLKAIGSHRVVKNAGFDEKDIKPGFLRRDILKRVLKIYDTNFRDGGKVYATYEVYYFVCKV